MLIANEKTNKHVRKYRAEYWATHQVDDDICRTLKQKPDFELITAKIMK